jgi:hypothetical protein
MRRRFRYKMSLKEYDHLRRLLPQYRMEEEALKAASVTLRSVVSGWDGRTKMEAILKKKREKAAGKVILRNLRKWAIELAVSGHWLGCLVPCSESGTFVPTPV